jgi:hypothetical protein
MILDWMRKIHQLEFGHRYESLKWNKVHFILGISASVLSLIIAFSFRFPSLTTVDFNNLPFFFKHDFLVALASTIVAILAGLQTFLKANSRATIHKNSASSYEALRHELEQILTYSGTLSATKSKLSQIRKQWNSLDSINISKKNFKKGKRQVQSYHIYPIFHFLI